MGTAPSSTARMSEFVPPFEVRSRLTNQSYQVRFSHLWNAISTRHADAVDCKFFVNGRGVVVGLAHPAFVKFRERTGRELSDREASFVAAEFLRERLEEEDEHALYDVSTSEVLRLMEKLDVR